MEASLQFGSDEWKLVYRVALRVLKAPDQAEDAAQDALLSAYQARDKFAGRSQPASWLYRIAHNTALSHLRSPFVRRHASGDVSDLLEQGQVANHVQQAALPSPVDAAMGAQLETDLGASLARLSALDRLAFTERFVLGTTEQELGAILGVSTNAAKQRAFRARRAVRTELGPKWRACESR